MVENHQGARYRPYLQQLYGPALLLIIVVATFWKITLSHRQFTWLESPDIANQVMPWLQFQAGEFHRGVLAFWDPYSWGGQSLIGQAQPAVAYPLNWLLYAMPLKNGWIQQVYLDGFFILIHYLGALFCYWLCRDLGRSRAAALLGGSAFALSGWMSQTDWPQMLNGGIWAPLVFLFFFRMMRAAGDMKNSVRNAALSGGMFGIAFLSGHHQIPIFIGLAIGGAWLYWLYRELQNKASFRRIGYCAAAFGLLFGMMAAFQILPASEYGQQAVRWVGANNVVGWKDAVPYRVHSFFSMPPTAILGLVILPYSDHTTPFVGFTVLLMGISGVVAGWRNVFVRIMAAVALGGFFLALGQWNIFHGLIYALLPQVDKARNIAFGAFVFGFGVSVLASFGLDLFLENTAYWKRLLAYVAGFGGLLLGASTFLLAQTSLPKTGDYNLILMCGLLAILLGAALLCWQHGIIRNGARVVLCLAVLEFGSSLGWGYRHAESPDYLLKKMSIHSELAQWLRNQPGPIRVELDDEEIAYNFGDWYGIEVYGGYLASLTVNTLETAGQYPARALMGVKYMVGRKELYKDKEFEVWHDSRGVKIWEHPDVFPRVWTVHKTRAIPAAQRDAAMNVGLEKLREEAFFIAAKAPEVDRCAGDRVDLVRRGANEIEIDAVMVCKGVVIAGESYDKGWRATVDGVSTPVLEAYSIARGVVVPRGHHRIVMHFYTRAIVLGAGLTALGFLILLGLLIL